MLKHPFIEQIGERRENSQIWFDIIKEMGYVPKLPQSLYDAADKAVAEKDRIPYFLKLLVYVMGHKQYMNILPLIICETLGKSYGSINRALLWAALMSSPLSDDLIARAGWGKNSKHKFLNLIPKARHLCTMDMLFQTVDDTPQGAVVAVSDPDPDKFTRAHIATADHKLNFWCKEIDDYMPRITPEKEETELAKNGEYPMILSAGRHSDGGDNGIMRNPATYVYRQPYTIAINPEDAKGLGIENGQECRVTTKAGRLAIPAEYTYQAGRGYALIPHHFGFDFGGKTVGTGVNELTSCEDLDPITGNPYFRYVPCRIEQLVKSKEA